MCNYCENEQTMMEVDTIKPSTASFLGGIKEADIWRHEYRLGVFIDTRGYLRLVDLDDCNCLDGGEKIKINFCSICGKKMEFLGKV